MEEYTTEDTEFHGVPIRISFCVLGYLLDSYLSAFAWGFFILVCSPQP